MQSIQARVSRSIGRSKAEVFLRDDFEFIGSYAQVGKALNSLTKQGRLVRLGYGVYAKARPSSLSGKPVPRTPLESLAREVLEKLDVTCEPGMAAQEYLRGGSQIPARVTYNTGSRRISRKLTVGREQVAFENNYGRAG
jgi:Family of unknown function (DUF6088)